LSPSTYNYYENGRMPPADVIARIHQVTGCDLRWLLTGDPGRPQADHGPGHSALHGLVDDLIEVDPGAEPVLRAFIEVLMNKAVAAPHAVGPVPGPQPQPSEARTGWIPILGRTAAGIVHFWAETGLPEPTSAALQLDALIRRYATRPVQDIARGRLAVEGPRPADLGGFQGLEADLVQLCPGKADVEPVVQFVDCPQLRRRWLDAFALQVDGDSMAPRINDGQVVILSPSVPAVQGQPAVVQVDGQIGVTCKLIRITEQEVHLVPINERYAVQTVPRDRLRWALAVLCHMCL